MFYKETSTATSNSIMSEFPLNSPTTSFMMTPNTIKTIEQSILASLEVQTSNPQIIASAATGSFVPPLPSQPHPPQQQQPTIIHANNWQGANIRTENNNQENNSDTFSDDDNSMETDEEIEIKTKKKNINKKNTGRRGGRRRNGNHGNHGEEDERRLVRRERNKLAAARCRKRRVDHTNMLVEETESLESTRSTLQSQIQLYQQKKEEFEFLLQAHIPACTFAKEEKYNPTTSQIKPRRPNTLPMHSNNIVTSSGISITTPSNGLNIGFGDIDWSELPSTGLTPTAVSSGGGSGGGLGGLVTPLVTPGTVRDILSGLANNSGNCGGGGGGSGGGRFVNL